jgi:hypothetical protein
MNFNCVFPACSYKGNGIEEIDFLNHIRKEHYLEMLEISKKENMPINIIEMITISNSTVFINT